MINLSQNENPYGCSPRIKQAIIQSHSIYSRYPDENVLLLRNKLAKHLCVDHPQILLTNGSAEALELVIKAFSLPGCEVILPQYAFSFYKAICQNACLSVNEVANDGHQDLAAMANAITANTRFIFLTNPSNPMGTYIKYHDLEILMSTIPNHVLVIIDEAYYEYVAGYENQYQSAIKLVESHENLVITRTFSKAYGLAGLRIGYCISNHNAIRTIYKIKNPHNVNSLALIAAEVALDDQAFLDKTRIYNQQGFNQLVRGFEQLNLRYLNQSTNFITIDLKQDAKLFAMQLFKNNIIVKTLGEYDLPHHIRVSVGLMSENNLLLETIKQLLI